MMSFEDDPDGDPGGETKNDKYWKRDRDDNEN